MTRWPTLLLAAVALGGQGCVVFALGNGLPPALGVLGGTVCAWMAFTAVHEAAHRHLPGFDALVGHLCVTCVLGALGPYRFLHGQHHRFPDDAARDPDAWSTASGRFLALRWLTADVGYLWFYARHWSRRPASERAELVVRGLVYVLAIPLTALVAPGWAWALLFGWWIPGRITLTVLAWGFAWLPHTGMPQGPVGVWRYPVVTVLMLGQNFHLAHHRAPERPFWVLGRA